ncbi:Uncharacterised protein [Klebsiella pneumoniae]|nr:Uncharacterised protein [Klebsiella pneumoniae]
MSLKHRLPELEASIDPAALRAAADEYSDLLLTLCLCMKMAGPPPGERVRLRQRA